MTLLVQLAAVSVCVVVATNSAIMEEHGDSDSSATAARAVTGEYDNTNSGVDVGGRALKKKKKKKKGNKSSTRKKKNSTKNSKNDSVSVLIPQLTQQQGEICGGFLWKDGTCDDGLSCFTGGDSNNYCVPNGKENACCYENGIECGFPLSCYSGYGCTGTVPTCKTGINKYQKIVSFVKQGSCNWNTGEPAAAGDGFVTGDCDWELMI